MASQVLGAINISAGERAIEEASLLVAKRLESIEPPRSLAELGLTEPEFEWLIGWARELPAAVARSWIGDRSSRLALGDMTRQQGLGLLLFLVTAEVARREAAEGFVWSVVSRKFERARPALFTRGQPTYYFKSAFEAVARRFRLRNVFGLEGTQNWYVSTYLQFGFTFRGIGQLPYRLSGHPLTESIEQLLGSGTNASPTFQRLWHDLRSYRRGNVLEQRIRSTLRGSPWVLPTWEDNVVAAAKERLDLEASSEAAQDELSIPFIGQAAVSWPPGERPVVSLPLQNLAVLLSEGTYDVHLGRQHIRRIVCSEDGDVVGDDPIQVELRAPNVTATVRQDDGSPLLSQEVALWEQSEDVAAFDLATGRRIDPWRDAMQADHPYALILADDVDLAAVAPSRALAAGFRAHRLEAGWSDVEARLDGALLWEAFSEGSPPPQPPEWIRSVDAEILSPDRDLAIGQTIRLRVFNLSGDLQFVRVGSTPVDFEQTGRHAKTQPIVLEPEHFGAELRILVGVRAGIDVRAKRLSIALNIQGALLLTEEGWQPIGEESVLPTSAIESGRLRLLWQEDSRPLVPRFSVMEGPTLVRSAWSGSSVLRGLAGFGAQLTVRERFNSENPRPLLVVAGSILNQGICSSATFGLAGGMDVQLEYPLEPGGDHTAMLVLNDGIVQHYRCGDGLLPGADWSVWRVAADGLDGDSVAAAAIAYQGRRLGAFFFPGLHHLTSSFTSAEPEEEATFVAAVSRWLQAPILGSRWRGPYEQLATQYPCEVLGAWLTDVGLPAGFHHGSLSDAWLAAVRSFYLRANLTLSADAFETLWSRLVAHDPRQSRLGPLDILDELTPDLFYVGAKWAIAKGLGTKQTIAEFLFPEGLERAAIDSLNESAELLQVDENFVKRGIGDQVRDWLVDRHELEEPHWRNLEISYNLPCVRRYVAARILHEVI